jgi:poly-gamma-glutamate synthesis protein (capsule biosynthesis protein)
MIARKRQVALALTALLTAGAACQAHERGQDPFALPGAPAAREFTLAAAGDVLPDNSVAERAQFDAGGIGYDFRPLLAGAQRTLSRADLALCHLVIPGGGGAEVPDATDPQYLPGVARGLAAAGYDDCSTASAHSLDDGAEGIRRTLDALDRAGVRHAGSARTRAESKSVTMLRAGSAKVAHLAYTDDTGVRRAPEGMPWAVGLIDEDRIVADARAAREAGADVVVVSVDGGTATQEEPDARLSELTEHLTAARTGTRPDIDLVLGTRAHVPQAYEKVNGTWVVHGLGDQVAGETPDDGGTRDPRAGESSVARFTFAPPARPGERWRVTRAEFVPQWFDIDAGRVVDLNEALARGADVSGVRDSVRDVVLSRGAADEGLRMGH